MKIARIGFLIIWLTALGAGGMSPVLAEPEIAGERFSGVLNVLDGDGAPGSDLPPQTLVTLTMDGGEVLALDFDGVAQLSGDWRALRGQRVSVNGRAAPAEGLTPNEAPALLRVESLRLEDGALAPQSPQAQLGSKPWVTIACRFSDIPTETQPLSYFTHMYDNSIGRLDHYFREISYNQMNVAGSAAYGWFVLPHTNAYYTGLVSNGNYSSMLNALANDCTAQANAVVNFNPFTGINLMFNAAFGPYAWGGSLSIILDDRNFFYMTWEPPWGLNDITVIKHEMGHGYGLPHSSGMYGATYDNSWDVMSDSWKGCWNNFDDFTYGCMGQGTISYHRDRLGWIPANQKTTVAYKQSAAITLDWLEKESTSNQRMAVIPIYGTNKYYTVEGRGYAYTPGLNPWPGYDEKFDDWLHAFGDRAIVIHEIDPNRADGRPANVVDIDLNGVIGDDGSIFKVGETYNSGGGIMVSVLSATVTGFTVRIGNNAGPFDKSAPANSATGQAVDLTLSWQASGGATGYEYCYDTSDDGACTNWVSAGANTSAALSGLSRGTTYYWQVRANGPYGVFYANNNQEWRFTTVTPPPAAFSKSSPGNSAVNQAISPTLSWTASSGAARYEICYDTTNDNACANWVNTGLNTTLALTGLAPQTTYYWQARAVNGGGTTYAGGGYWSFTTLYPPPAGFGSGSPANGSTGLSSSVTLSWQPSAGAVSYEYCLDAANDGACSTSWKNVGGATTVQVNGLSATTTYYWLTRAVNPGGTIYANGETWWNFRTGVFRYIFLPVIKK